MRSNTRSMHRPRTHAIAYVCRSVPTVAFGSQPAGNSGQLDCQLSWNAFSVAGRRSAVYDILRPSNWPKLKLMPSIR